MPQSRKFILQQTATLLRLGVAPIDVERSISWVEAHLPPDADATAWIPSAADLADDGVVTEAAVQDSRAAWYLDRGVEKRFKRLLDARSEA